MSSKVAIITTTIYVPEALEAYADNARSNGHSNLFFVVTGDKKTPEGARSFCERLKSSSNYDVVYLGTDEQNQFLSHFPELHAHVPWNCIQRRNISILYAYISGADVIITMDDDNLFIEGSDYVGRHSIVGNRLAVPHMSANTEWVNICDTLEEKRGTTFYHRGFPMEQRWRDDVVVTETVRESKIVVNAGLWLGDPDVDAIVRIGQDVVATSYKRGDATFALDIGHWCPFNSQNTSVAREVIPAYWMCPCVGRYDDIWPSYVVRRIADHLGHVVAYGAPIVKQERHPHNYFVDFDNERSGMELTGHFTTALRGLTLAGRDYHTCLLEVHDGLRAWLGTAPLNDNRAHRSFIEGFIGSMWVWHKTMERCMEYARTGANVLLA